MYVKAHIRAELEEQVLDLRVGRGGRPSLFWRLALVVLWYDYRAISRLVPFGGPGTTGREPAQRPYDRVSLSLPQCTYDRFAVSSSRISRTGTPSSGGSARTTRTPTRLGKTSDFQIGVSS
jgi:hypothetical protein